MLNGPRGEPMGLRAKDGGKSEGRLVMRRIKGVRYPYGNITTRESGQIPAWSLVARNLMGVSKQEFVE